MKLKGYKRYEDFKTVTFESDAGYQVEFDIWNDGDIKVETDGVKLTEIKECIAIIESGKLEIIL